MIALIKYCTAETIENTRPPLVFSTFPSCSQMPVVFYHSVMHGLGFFICCIADNFSVTFLAANRGRLIVVRLYGSSQSLAIKIFAFPIHFEMTSKNESKNIAFRT